MLLRLYLWFAHLVYSVSPNTKDLSYSLKVTQGFLSKVGHVELVRDSVLFAVWHSAVSWYLPNFTYDISYMNSVQRLGRPNQVRVR
jgi:hypothetical protein